MPREILNDTPCFLSLTKRHPNVKCFIFDMDGTLLDSEKTHSLAVTKLLEDHGHNDITTEWVEDSFSGLADQHVFDELINMNKLDRKNISQNEFIDKKNEKFKDIVPSISKNKLLHFKIEDFLKMAKKSNYKTALVTASEKVVTKTLIDHIEIGHLFDTVKSREDFTETKPHPMPYISTIKELGLNHDEVIIFEDSKTGLESALKSGAIVYQAKWFNEEIQERLK